MVMVYMCDGVLSLEICVVASILLFSAIGNVGIWSCSNIC